MTASSTWSRRCAWGKGALPPFRVLITPHRRLPGRRTCLGAAGMHVNRNPKPSDLPKSRFRSRNRRFSHHLVAPKISSPSARETPDESQTARSYRLPAIAELWTAKTQQSDEDFGGPTWVGRYQLPRTPTPDWINHRDWSSNLVCKKMQSDVS